MKHLSSTGTFLFFIPLFAVNANVSASASPVMKVAMQPEIKKDFLQWFKSDNRYKPNDPTLLFVATTAQCAACISRPINSLINTINSKNLDVNIAVVIVAELKGQGMMEKRFFHHCLFHEDYKRSMHSLLHYDVSSQTPCLYALTSHCRVTYINSDVYHADQNALIKDIYRNGITNSIDTINIRDAVELQSNNSYIPTYPNSPHIYLKENALFYIEKETGDIAIYNTRTGAAMKIIHIPDTVNPYFKKDDYTAHRWNFLQSNNMLAPTAENIISASNDSIVVETRMYDIKSQVIENDGQSRDTDVYYGIRYNFVTLSANGFRVIPIQTTFKGDSDGAAIGSIFKFHNGYIIKDINNYDSASIGKNSIPMFIGVSKNLDIIEDVVRQSEISRIYSRKYRYSWRKTLLFFSTQNDNFGYYYEPYNAVFVKLSYAKNKIKIQPLYILDSARAHLPFPEDEFHIQDIGADNRYLYVLITEIIDGSSHAFLQQYTSDGKYLSQKPINTGSDDIYSCQIIKVADDMIYILIKSENMRWQFAKMIF